MTRSTARFLWLKIRKYSKSSTTTSAGFSSRMQACLRTQNSRLCQGCFNLINRDLVWKTLICNQSNVSSSIRKRWASQHAFNTKKGKSNTLYDVLELLPSATQKEIKTSYYELSKKYHPDINLTAEARHKFSELTQAYTVLSKLNTRREYDKEIGTYYMTRSTGRKMGTEKVLRLMDDLVEIDVTRIEQTSAFLNTAIPLSTLFRVPVRFNNIHGPKSSYGVQGQDIRMLHLQRQLCNGTLVANRGSSTATFIPGDMQGGIFATEAGRDGSVGHLVESALPCLALGRVPMYSRTNMLQLRGTTHSKHGPHMDYLDKVYRPLVENFGFQFTVETKKKSYFPLCDGKVVIRSLPVPRLTAVDLTEPGTLNAITGWVFVAGSKPIRVAQIMSKLTRSALKAKFPSIPIDIESVRDRDSRTEGTGQGVMILGETSTGVVIGGTSLWKRGMSNEEVVDRAVGVFIHNAKGAVCVDEMIQDKLIPYMALAEGRSLIRTSRVTSRAAAAMLAVEAMSEVRFQFTHDAIGDVNSVIISCEGLGMMNEYLDNASSA